MLHPGYYHWETWLNTEKVAIEQLNQQLAQLEQQLNQKVYELFELTQEEIIFKENNIKVIIDSR
jgi:hypothetical protein